MACRRLQPPFWLNPEDRVQIGQNAQQTLDVRFVARMYYIGIVGCDGRPIQSRRKPADQNEHDILSAKRAQNREKITFQHSALGLRGYGSRDVGETEDVLPALARASTG